MSDKNDTLSVKRHLNVSEIAEYLGLTRWTIFRMCKAGEIPFTTFGKNIKRFDRVAIDEWVKQRTVPGKV